MGLIVIFLFFGYLVLTIILAEILARVGRKKNIRWMNYWSVWLVMFFILVWDIPIGQLNFYRYCKNEAGIEVYKRVGLSNEFYIPKGKKIGRARYYGNNDGSVERRRFTATGDEMDLKEVKQKYNESNLMHQKDVSRWGYVDRFETVMSINNKVLARAVSFRGGGGWLAEFFGSMGVGLVGDDCPKDAIGGYSMHSYKLYDEVFYRLTDGMNQGAKHAYTNQ